MVLDPEVRACTSTWPGGAHVAAHAGVQLGTPQMLVAPPTVALAFVPQSEALVLLHAGLISKVEPSSDGTLQVCQMSGFT